MTSASSAARVSVLIATYNRGEMLDECIESVLRQTHAPHQVLVIDDGSTDDTPARIARYGESVASLRLVNGGKSRALNAAMPHVTGDFVWIFDDDDVALPTSIADRLAVFEPQAGAVFSKHFWGCSGESGRIERGELIKWPEVNASNVGLTMMRGCFTTLQGALVRTQCYREVGPFREELLRSQDYDMLIRLVRRFPVVLLREPTFVFRRHSGQRGGAQVQHAAAERDRVWAKYDAMVGRRLRQDAVLGEFLVPSVHGGLTPAQERAATLNRLSVMASKGIGDAMLEDAAQLVSIMQRDGPSHLTPGERELLVGAAQQTYFLHNTLSDPLRFAHEARSLGRTRSGRAILRAFARGLFGVAWWGLHDFRRRGQAVRLAVRLLAASVGPGALRREADASA
jgi:hypothetical protein